MTIGLSTPVGPSSRKVRTSSRSRVSTPAANRTVSRACRTQYAGSVISSAVTSSPVRLLTIGNRGGVKVSSASTSANGASIGSMSAEWKAWLTARRRTRTPRATSAVASRSSSAPGPASTVAFGALTAATDTPAPANSAASASGSATASMPPPSGSACMSAPRAATRRHAAGRLSTPATWAAVISPIEWPSRKSGRTPQLSRSRKSATSTANSAGWV